MARNLIRCAVCDNEAFCIAVTAEHVYYECGAPTAQHQWQEPRNPACARCGERLTVHTYLTDEIGDSFYLCPAAVKEHTFVRPT